MQFDICIPKKSSQCAELHNKNHWTHGKNEGIGTTLKNFIDINF
jgi:hypothetical protein